QKERVDTSERQAGQSIGRRTVVLVPEPRALPRGQTLCQGFHDAVCDLLMDLLRHSGSCKVFFAGTQYGLRGWRWAGAGHGPCSNGYNKGEATQLAGRAEWGLCCGR